MGREKRVAFGGATTGDHAKERHKRDRRGNLMDWTAPLPPGLVARPEKPRISSKHKSWFEFIENKDKKKKLEFEFTERKEPPPGFEFVPIGNPALTTTCKELSREQGAMIFIVTSSYGHSKRLSLHLNRVGHHIRQTIVEQARASLGDDLLGAIGIAHGQPEPIPESQEDINKQADAAIRDLFPRIPNTDRQMIIEHAFNKSRLGKGDPPVGLAAGISLSRRVQLAVLAHIRHNHTRYDQLLRETTYVNARKAVESLCLDILVKWRGDEETGRDQLDEILCEVIVISDSESDESDDDEDDESSIDASSADESPVDRAMGNDQPDRAAVLPVELSSAPSGTDDSRGDRLLRATHAPQKVKKTSHKDRRAAKWAQRGFHRYQAARDQAWHQAVERQRLGNGISTQSAGPTAVSGPASHGPQPWGTGGPDRPNTGLQVACSPVEPSYPAHRSYSAALPPVDASRERGSRVDELQQAFPAPIYQRPQAVRIQENPSGTGFRPIVGSQTVPYLAAEVERVSYHGQDLKDYLVQSVESELSDVPSRFPVQHRLPEHGVESSARTVTHHCGRTGGNGERNAAHGSRSAFAEEGFIRLPPRSDLSRMSLAPAPRSEPFVLLNPQPASAVRDRMSTDTSDGPSLRRPTAWQDDIAAPASGTMLRSRTRPIWIGHDGAILRSEFRPIVIQERPSPSRQPQTDSASESRRPSPMGWTSDAHPAGAVQSDQRDRRYVDARMDQRIEAMQGDFVEIVRVSNKFPRQHEPRPGRPGLARYDLRPAAPLQALPQHVDAGVTLRNTRQLPAQGHRAERVLGIAERPSFRDENALFAARQPEEYLRQERVVGIEYVDARPRIDPRTYSDRDHPYNVGKRVYQPRSTSVIPVPYPGVSYRSQVAAPVPRRDEVITLD